MRSLVAALLCAASPLACALVAHRTAMPLTTLRRPQIRDIWLRVDGDGEGEGKEEESLDDSFEAGLAYGKDIKARFMAPRIDDPGLPYADSLVCVCGSIFIAQLALLGVLPYPTWLEPLNIPGLTWRGLPYILPALSHGAGLASCWVLGALAAKAFERGAYMESWQEALSRTWRGGAFATGMLVLSTQLVTAVALSERGIDYTVPSTEADYEVIRRGFEVICDIAVQAVGLTAFRLYRWRDAQP